MKLLLFLFIAITSITSVRASSIDVDEIRAQKLEKYKFTRGIDNYKDVQLLVGNGEMGALARQDGLGFDQLWFSDFWRTAAARMPLFGPQFKIDKESPLTEYSQVLSLEDGVLTTIVKRGDCHYKSELFFSEADKDLLVIRLSDFDFQGNTLTLSLPVLDTSKDKGSRHEVVKSESDLLFLLNKESSHCITGSSIDEAMRDPRMLFKAHEPYPFTNKMVYGVWCSAPLKETNIYGQYSLNIENAKEVTLVFTEATSWHGGNLVNNVLNQLHGHHDYSLLHQANLTKRKENWTKTPVIELPDERFEQLWYRSLYWQYSTSASEKFLTGECQFAFEGWNMIPFTYGSAGWGVHAFTMLGNPENALKMLKQHDKPEAQNRNALHWLQFAEKERKESGLDQAPPYKQDIHSKEARCFAHEIQTSGDGTLVTFGNQGHLHGFALELFQRYYNYYPSEEFLLTHLYPVAKGIAEFWANFLIWDHKSKEYITPKTWGASEGGMQNNPLDAVLAVKKCMKAAVKYANMLNKDEDLVEKWEFIGKNIHLPTNEQGYVAYKGHNVEFPKESTGYHGVRFINAFNFVNQELIEEIDPMNVEELLEKTAISNKFGQGFAVFHSAQSALAECMFGRGNSALGYMEGILKALDKSGTCLRECEDRGMVYFLTNSNAYMLVPVFMMLQSNSEKIKLFPAIPDKWKNVRFYNLPIDNNRKVSAEMKNGKIKHVQIMKDGEVIKSLNHINGNTVKVADLK